MSDLQDALGWADDIIAVIAQDQYEPMVVHVEKIVEAAGKYANPDIDAATVRILERLDLHEHTQAEWDKAHILALVALSVTEDE